MSKTAEEELLELLEQEHREQAKKDFWQFCVHMNGDFFTEGKWHLRKIAKALQDMYEGKLKKIAISLPPRAGKSYIISMFCAWLIGHDGGKDSIMRNSYAADLANRFSVNIRDAIQSEKYLEIFPDVKLRTQAVEGWSTKKATDLTYFCAGVGGPITGKGCRKVAILDDPLKNIEEALSPIILDNIWNWYTSTHLSRMERGCNEIQIATRWSRRDVIGRLTDPESEEYDPDWHVISVPALINGKSFCEEIMTTEEYLKLKNLLDDYIWEAEYMQNPIEVKGLMFPIDTLNRFSLKDLKPADGVIGYTDPADTGIDFTSSVIGKRVGDYTYITDVVFTQEGVNYTIPAIAQMIIDTDCDVMKVESNAGGKLFSTNVRDLLKGKSFCKVIFEPNMQNKETRIIMSAGYIQKYFYFRNDYSPGSDYDKFMRQLTSYVKMGKNKHDDAPDSLTGLALYMEKNFRKPEEKAKDPRIVYGGKYLKSELIMKGFKKSEIKKMVKQGVLEVIGE